MLSGEFDLSNRHLLAQGTASFAKRRIDGPELESTDRVRTGKFEVVIDASQLTFIDAAATGVLVKLNQALAHDNVRLRTRRPSPALQRVTTICGLHDALGMEPAQPDATRRAERGRNSEPTGRQQGATVRHEGAHS